MARVGRGVLGASAAVALSATAVAVGPANVAAAAGVDAFQVVRVRPSGATVELLRGLADGTPVAVVTTGRPAALQRPTTDTGAASEAIRSVARRGSGALSATSVRLSGSGASQGAPPADAKAPSKDLRPTQTPPAPAPVRPSPARGSTGSTRSGGDDRSRSLLFSIAAALAAIAILGAGLTINRRERRARRRGALRPLGAAADGRPNEALPRLARGADAEGVAGPEAAVQPAAIAAATKRRDGPDGHAAAVGTLDDSSGTESPEPEPVEPVPNEPESSQPESSKRERADPEPGPVEPAVGAAAASVDEPGPDDPATGAPTAEAPRPPRSTVRARPSRAADLPSLDDLLVWSTRGVATGRTWVVSPSAADLQARWDRLVAAPLEERAELFVVDERRDLDTMVEDVLPDQAPARRPLATERHGAPMPMRYARRSFDRQWLLPDLRVVDRPNVPLWSLRQAPAQLFLTAAATAVPLGGPALVSTAALPQFNHFNGQRSRVWPLWLDRGGAEANVADDVLPLLEHETGVAVSAPDLVAYVTAVVAHPGYGARFARELSSGVVRVPVTTDAEVLVRGTALGHEVLRLQTLGEHRPPALRHRAPGPLLRADAPVRPRLEAPLSHQPGNRPDTAIYDPSDGTLIIGDGVVTDITLDVWDYEVGGMPVIEQWLAQRLTPGARRRQSRLDLITVDAWEAGWTAELLLVLSALTGLRGLEAAQQALLDEVLQGPHLARADVDAPRRAPRTLS